MRAFVFLAGALVIGSFLSPWLFRAALALRSTGVVQALSLSFCFALFVRMGMLVDVRSFADASVLGFAALLALAAVLGKLACAIAVPEGMPRPAVGLGMMPRGEVGLIFAGIGVQLVLAGRPVVDAGTYAAAVFMVVVTTMATPPALLWALRRHPLPSVDTPGGSEAV